MNRLKKWFSVIMLATVLTVAQPPEINAQCPMCKMSAESNLKNGGTAGKGLNNGILYMLLMPYVVFGVIGFMWWKNNKVGPQNN